MAQNMIDAALAIAVQAHTGELDKDGGPEILHPIAVGMMGETDEEKAAGFLHDVIEDHSDQFSFDYMLSHGISATVVDALRLLTHDKDALTYDEYIDRILASGNKLALAVKIHDLTHNLQRGKASGHLDTVAKHQRAYDRIMEFTKQS